MGTGKPNPSAELKARNWQAYDYYLQCEVDQTHLLPRDGTVLQNNALIRMVVSSVDQQQQNSLMAMMMMGGR